LLITRRAFAAALSLTALISKAMAVPADEVTRPQALRDMALGPDNAKVTIVEYAAPTCPHCAAFNKDVFPKLKSEFIDTGKVRYVFREFPLNIKDVACSMLTRTIADGDSAKYFAVADIMFNQQDRLVEKTAETLKLIGKQAGLSSQAVEDCLKDQALMDKLTADRQFAIDVLKVDGTPTFFINGAMMVGEVAFDAFEKRIKSLLKT
jgi:protein-disulfide isomerase